MSRTLAPLVDFGTWIIKAFAGQLTSLALIAIAAGMIFRPIFHHLALVLLLLQFPGIVAFPLWYAARQYIDKPRKSALIFAAGTFLYLNAFMLIVTYLGEKLGILIPETAKILIMPIFIGAFLGSAVVFYQAFRRLSTKHPEAANLSR